MMLETKLSEDKAEQIEIDKQINNMIKYNKKSIFRKII